MHSSNLPKWGMHLTAPGSICSILGIWKSTPERYESLKPISLPKMHVASIYFGCGGQTVLFVRDVERMVVGRQRVDG